MKNFLIWMLYPLHRWIFMYMARSGLILFGSKGSSPPPPDYTPVATASKEAAELSAQLGEKQLTEAQRQYDQNMAVAKPVVDAQLETMRQGIKQGEDYYEYGKSFRPLEQSMMNDVLTGPTDAADKAERDAIAAKISSNADELKARAAGYEAEAKADTALFTGGNQGIYDKYKADIDTDVGTAMADAREGQTQAINAAMRQALRYGMDVPSSVGNVATQGASAIAAAANGTRNNAINNYRNIVGQGIDIKRGNFVTGQGATSDAMTRGEGAMGTGRNMRIQDDSLKFARKLDVAGMARGMPGASQGAYGMATNAGNSAVQNQQSSGNNLMAAMNQSNNTRMSGQQVAMQGLTGILNSQTSAYNTGQQSGDTMGSMLGGLGGAAMGIAKVAPLFMSDRRLKSDIVQVGTADNGLGVYEFRYTDDESGKRYRGVMADEVEKLDSEAVHYNEAGYAMVNYGRLGMTMQEA